MNRNRAVVLAVIILGATLTGCMSRIAPYREDAAKLLSGESTASEFIQKVRDREFNASARLSVLDVRVDTERKGEFGETVEADPGYAFYFVRVKFENTGTIALGVSTWHFDARAEPGFDAPAETYVAHQDFDGRRVHPDSTRIGTLVFEFPEDAHIMSVTWNGDLTSTTSKVTSSAP